MTDENMTEAIRLRFTPPWAGAGIYLRQSPEVGQSKPLIALLIGAKIYKSIAVYILPTLFASIAFPNILATTDETTDAIIASKEAFITNIHAPPVAIFGRWSSTIQILTLVQLSSGIIEVFFEEFAHAKSSNTDSGWRLWPFSSISSIWSQRTGLRNQCDTHMCQRSSISQILRTIVHSATSTLFLLVWVSALQLCGPYRTLLCTAPYYEYTIAGLISPFFIFKSGVSGARLRGTMFYVMGILILLIPEQHSYSSPNVHSRTNMHETGNLNLDVYSKHVIGIFLLSVWIILRYIISSLNERHLGEQVASFKGKSTLISGIGLLLMTFADFLNGADMIGFNMRTGILTSLVALSFTVEHYVDKICLQRIEGRKVARIGTLSTLASALFFSFISNSDVSPDLNRIGAIMGWLVMCLALLHLTVEEKVTGSGSLIGYSADGVPLLSFSKQHSWSEPEAIMNSTLSNALIWCSFILQEMQTNLSSRRTFKLFIIHLLMAVLEFSYGASFHSSAFIGDSVFKLFQTIVLLITLNSMASPRMKPKKLNPIGYGREEVLSAFITAIILIVISSGIIWNAINCSVIFIFSGSYSLDLINSQTTTIMPFMTLICLLLLNAFGIYFIQTSCVDNCLYSIAIKTDGGLKGIILSYTFRYVLLSACILFQAYDFLIFDSFCSIALATLSIKIAYPLLLTNGRSMLLTIPIGSEKNIQHALLQVLTIEGVQSYDRHRLWVHSPNVYVGTIHLHAASDANEQKIIRQVSSLFLSMGFTYFTVQVEKDQFIQSANTTGSSFNEFTASDTNDNAPLKL